MANIYDNITETIGRTPIVRIQRLTSGLEIELMAKVEAFNPMGSLKDRIGLAMIEALERQGKINARTRIVEPTSGNTGIALAFVCAARGYDLTLTMPENLSLERRRLFELLGARVVLTPAQEGMKGAIEEAQRLLARESNAVMPNQFDNPVNPDTHAQTTAVEILNDTDGRLDVLVAGVGTGGSLTGIARVLKEKIPGFICVAVEPENSPVLSGGMPGPHLIQGIGAGFIPRILDRDLIDHVVRIGDQRAIKTARLCARLEGIACGISSGAALAAALEIGEDKAFRGKRILALLPDFADRYLSMPQFLEL
ncbi:MAG: cysteine synthase A [Magnetococcales bacterium]|nr:cysteine synthase A [Magnetococcales bacterium]MBF0151612.1 cysteine synthase A [Magnetococcales bacterium]MBF0172224.1 cysteine synthase A [Magnetococcales bacterium]MBF0349211.1 cysteine synthase A [Magnetococcales bacterium]MBF0631520.1 cysteine synthase A [Magnetococcales bacterium]